MKKLLLIEAIVAFLVIALSIIFLFHSPATEPVSPVSPISPISPVSPLPVARLAAAEPLQAQAIVARPAYTNTITVTGSPVITGQGISLQSMDIMTITFVLDVELVRTDGSVAYSQTITKPLGAVVSPTAPLTITDVVITYSWFSDIAPNVYKERVRGSYHVTDTPLFADTLQPAGNVFYIIRLSGPSTDNWYFERTVTTLHRLFFPIIYKQN